MHRIVWTILVLLLPVVAAAKPLDGPNQVIAQVGDEVLTKGELARVMANLDPSRRQQIARSQQAMLQLIRTELQRRAILGEARKAHWDRRPEIAARAEHAAQDVVITSYLETRAAPPENFPTDDAVRAFYNANLSHFMQPRQYHIAQIYLARPGNPTPAALATLRQRAADLARTLAAPGADFAAAAAKSSDDRDSRGHGGDLGWVSEKLIIPEIAKAVSGLADGEVSGAVELDDGWHILRELGTRPPSPAPLDAVKADIISTLRGDETTRLEETHIDDLMKSGHAAVDLEAVQALLAKSH